MPASGLDPLTRLTIELALTAGRGDPALHRRQDADARSLGMSGAEIDAARDGRSFDLRRSRAMALALAGPGEDLGRLRACALQAGFDAGQCREIEALAVAVLALSRDAVEG